MFAGELFDLPEAMVDALYEAGCGDALIGTSGGILSISFDRYAPSFRLTLLFAIADGELAGLGLELARVDPE